MSGNGVNITKLTHHFLACGMWTFTETRKKTMKRKMRQEEATFINIEKDTERIILEQEKLQLEIENLKKRNRNLDFELATLKKLHCSMKLTNDFSISLE